MKGSIVFFFGLAIFFSFTACTQTQKLVRQAQGYYIERLPGNIPVDMNGRPLKTGADTIITVYVETSSDKVEWGKARKGQQIFLISATLMTDSSVAIGTDTNNNPEQMALSAAKGYLWRLDLSPGKIESSPLPENTPKKIILEYRFKGKLFTYVVDSFTQLQSPPSV